jgi:hypothetical protein
MAKRNKIWIAVIIVAMALIVQSCKKGCTDPTAINYVPGATHDDATCLYCDSFVQLAGTNETQAEDMNSSSAHFSQVVLLITVNANQVTYNGNACKMLGLGNANTNGCGTVTYTAVLDNETSSTLVVSGNIMLDVGGSVGTITYTVSSVSVQPFGSTSIGIGQVQCANSGFFDVSFQNPSFQYH